MLKCKLKVRDTEFKVAPVHQVEPGEGVNVGKTALVIFCEWQGFVQILRRRWASTCQRLAISQLAKRFCCNVRLSNAGGQISGAL